jgi:DNA polymerase elongation subunit (family B)
VCEWLKSKGIETFEGTVDPLLRWEADTVYEVVKPRRAYLDIETDSRVPFSRKKEMRILCWVVQGADAVHRGVLEADTDEAERVLLEELLAVLRDYDQIIGWNLDRFDLEVIRARATRVGLDVAWQRWLWLDHLELFRRLNVSAAESGDEKQSMALDAVARTILGEGKADFDASKAWEAWEAGGESRARLVDYCERDVALMPRIEERTGYIDLQQSICEACGTFLDSRGINPQTYVQAYLLRLAGKRGVRFATREPTETGGFRGAFVLDPQVKGIVKGVHVADFSGMYPSIILSWNISPETAREVVVEMLPAYLSHMKVEKRARPDGHAEVPGTSMQFVQDVPGVMAVAVAELIGMRKVWNERKAAFPPGTTEWKEADRRSTAYKVAANVFFGVSGAPTSVIYDPRVAESITQAGAWLIRETLKFGEEQGIRAVYGDTDSAFAVGVTAPTFKAFVERCNTDLYPRLLAEKGCARNLIKLAYEKEFERLVLVSSKRYAGRYAHYKGTVATEDSEPEVKGLEYKRGDAVRLARRMQKRAVDLLMKSRCEDPEVFREFVRAWRFRVAVAEVACDDVKISKRLTKPLRDYVAKKKKDGNDALQLPHIEIAKLLKARGEDVGEGARIDYVCADGRAKPKVYLPAADWTGDCDREDLWESLVWPATQRLLQAAFPAERWEFSAPRVKRAISAKSQLGLFA